MIRIPESDKPAFESLILRQAQAARMTPADYLRKVWYHEQAAKLGEYVALTIVDGLLPHAVHAIGETEQTPFEAGKLVEFANKS